MVPADIIGLCAPPERPAVSLLSLSIVIPAYNEENRLPQTIQRVVEYLDQRFSNQDENAAEILIVNDGSTDKTAEIARRAVGGKWPIRVVENPGNRGKGYAVRNGALAASKDWILITDADLSAPIEEADKLIEASDKAGIEIAFGSRAVDRSLVAVHQSWMREMSGRIFNLVMRAIVALPYSDTQCGFKLYSRNAARQIFSRQRLDGFGFDVEDLYIAKARGLRALEIPVRWSHAEGSKVSLWNGINAFYELLLVRWNALCGRYR